MQMPADGIAWHNVGLACLYGFPTQALSESQAKSRKEYWQDAWAHYDSKKGKVFWRCACSLHP
ncbi:MAG: hypothetical protein AB1861_01510 [Cyanobacteriota bacterium]